MLSIFPGLFPYGIIALVILRLLAGSYLLYRAFVVFYHEPRERRGFSVYTHTLVLKASGLLVIIGLFTQPAALAGLAGILWDHIRRARKGTASIWLSLFLAASLIALLLNGPGPLAFDLPL